MLQNAGLMCDSAESGLVLVSRASQVYYLQPIDQILHVCKLCASPATSALCFIDSMCCAFLR